MTIASARSGANAGKTIKLTITRTYKGYSLAATTAKVTFKR